MADLFDNPILQLSQQGPLGCIARVVEERLLDEAELFLTSRVIESSTVPSARTASRPSTESRMVP